jgi:tetratricopeptide (TPR) repeat protein
MKRRVAAIAGLALVTLGAGCAEQMARMGVNMTVPALSKASAAFAAESDVDLAREAAPGQIKTVEGFLVTVPDNRELLRVVSQAYLEYAFGFLEDDLESTPDDQSHAAAREHLTKRATGIYERSLDYALKLIATDDKDFHDAFMKDAATTEAEAKKLDHDAMAGLLFAGMALGSSINLNRNDVGRVVDLPKAIVLVKRAYALDPKFYNGGAAMTLGLIYSSQGKAMGGDPEAAKKYFDEAIAVSGGKYLMTKVFMARFYAVVIQDRALFESTLKEVLNTPANVFPEQRLANELAKRRAKRYLDHVEDYF